MAVTRDLALNKSATQSSICEHSRGKSIVEDAALVNNDDYEPWVSNHTAREASPWWEVDLSEICLIESIHIFNRLEDRHRFCNFTILHSIDHNLWDVAFTKCDPRHFNDLEIPIFGRVQCRFIRIRLDAYEALHLRKVKIYGMPLAELPPKQELIGDYSISAEKITVFSVLFNESLEFLKLLVSNFLHFTGKSERFIININVDIDLSNEPYFVSERVIFCRGKKRSALGASLLLGHLENIRLARDRFSSFDYFVPISSNSLFIRPFSINEIERRLVDRAGAEWYVEPNQIDVVGDHYSLQHHEWWWSNIERQQDFLAFVRNTLQADTLVPMQIEGLLAPAAQWERLADFAPAIEKMSIGLDETALFPMEEVVPATFFARHYDRNFTMACHVLWHPFRTMVRMDQVIQPSNYFPPHISIIKWFDRDLSAPETVAVCTDHGRALVRLISQNLVLDSFDRLSELSDLIRHLANGLDTLLVLQRGYRPDVGG